MDTDKIILIDKPAGITSFGVVARIRRVLSEQAGYKVKVGHAGTLDPFATGLLILLTGKKCAQANNFLKLNKSYVAEIVLGKVSTTGDSEGELTQVSEHEPSLEQVEKVLEKFVGEQTQQPPRFSAIKINGKRAYKLARQGKEMTMPRRTVQIFELALLSYDYPKINIQTHVSSGTYIRSLAEDIGKALGTGAYCSQLRRTRIDDYDIADAETMADFGISS